MPFRTLIAAAFALVALLATASQASAAVFVAYGEGLTRCTIQVEKVMDGGFLVYNNGFGHQEDYEWWGETTCDRPLEQTAQASLADLVSPMCSGIRTTCSSGGEVRFEYTPERRSEPTEYRITLRAPRGQGWIGAPTDCMGVGTDNLQCVLTAESSDVSTRWATEFAG